MRRCRPLLGTLVEVTAQDAATIEMAFEAITSVHTLMSAHKVGSDLSVINARAHIKPVTVHEWTAAVILRSQYWSQMSGGAFDVVKAGAYALKAGSIPRHNQQIDPVVESSWRDIQIRDGKIFLERPCCLDLGGIAKGFAVDMAISSMRQAGARMGLVNAGGDLRGFGDESWPVYIPDPRTRRPSVQLWVENCAVATSAGQRRETEDLIYTHLPGSNQRWSSVTVRAPTACDADALTKIVMSGRDEAVHCLAAASAEALGMTVHGHMEPLGADLIAA